jgi:hypothetical protein
MDIQRRIAQERVPTTCNGGYLFYRVRARIAQERVPAPHSVSLGHSPQVLRSSV